MRPPVSLGLGPTPSCVVTLDFHHDGPAERGGTQAEDAQDKTGGGEDGRAGSERQCELAASRQLSNDLPPNRRASARSARAARWRVEIPTECLYTLHSLQQREGKL